MGLRLLQAGENFLENAGTDRGPWLVVVLGVGCGAWFALPGRWQWLALLAMSLGTASAALAMDKHGRFARLRQALVLVPLTLAFGLTIAWAKSEVAGVTPIGGMTGGLFVGRVEDRDEIPAEHRVRLTLIAREPRSNRPIRIRIAVPEARDSPGAVEGAVVAIRALASPPRAPLIPGAYDFARSAWFDGLSATGSALAPVRVITPATAEGRLARWRHAIANHAQARIAGSAGGIAAAFASGERGGIARTDDAAMRDAGLTHLLSVSGLHVSAVVGIGYVLALRLLALIPALALRVRIPVLAAGVGAAFGVVYTLLTGTQVPTVRSCLGSLLVLGALAAGRDPLSMRLLAVAGAVVMVLWPEAVVGPSFQMSFGSVLAIVALHQSAPVRAFLAHRKEDWRVRLLRHLFLIFLTGLVIDLALMPIALFHFHRAGVYGSVANILAIPLTTFLTMPLLLLALVIDGVGLGALGLSAPVWWATGETLRILLDWAHLIARQTGAVALFPGMGRVAFGLFLGGMLWLALWHGRVRLAGLVPIALATLSLAFVRPPDLAISGDGRTLGVITADGAHLALFHPGRSDFAARVMAEAAGIDDRVMLFAQSTPRGKKTGANADAPPASRAVAAAGQSERSDPDAPHSVTFGDGDTAVCTRDSCGITLHRGAREWRILMLLRAPALRDPHLAEACRSVDIVVTQAKVFSPCTPRILRLDHDVLLRTGGVAMDLAGGTVTSVGADEGDHPWWRAPHRALFEPASEVPGRDMADQTG